MKYRKKPVTIEATQWLGTKASFDAILGMGLKDWEPVPMGGAEFYIKTLEGLMKVTKMDYVIRGVEGEFYPCKPNIFQATYEPISD